MPPSTPLPESPPDGSPEDLITSEDLFGDLVDAPAPVEAHKAAPVRSGPVRVQVAEAGGPAIDARPEVRAEVKKAAKPSDIPPEELALLLDAFEPATPSPALRDVPGPTAGPPRPKEDDIQGLVDPAPERPASQVEAEDLFEDLMPRPAAPPRRQDLSDLLEDPPVSEAPVLAPESATADEWDINLETDTTPPTSEGEATVPESAAFVPFSQVGTAQPVEDPALVEAEPPVEAALSVEVPAVAATAEPVQETETPESKTEAGESSVDVSDLDALMEASLVRGPQPHDIDALLDGFDALPSIEGEAPSTHSQVRFQASTPQVSPFAETRPDLDLAAVADEALGGTRTPPRPAGSSGAPGRAPAQGPYGPYQLLERVAVGGMAEVFKAKRSGVEGFEKVVALKRILSHLSDNKEFVEMFIGEAKIVAGLNHPNVVQIFDLGKIDKSYYIAMEYVHGRDLRSILRRAKEKGLRVPLDLSILIVARVCSALEYAHRKKDENGRSMMIVHRDISPQNILISFEGDVKLADFGIAKAASSAAITDRGVLRGKLLYMSPEQAWGHAMDRRSDIFSLGVVFYEMVTDAKLFMGSTERSILETVRECRVEPPSTLNSRIPERLEAVIMKALAKDPEQRYQDASEMYRDLERVAYLRQPPTAVELARFMEILFDADERGEPAPDEEASGENRPRAAGLEIDLDPGSAAPAPGPSAPPAPQPERSDSGINRLLRKFGIK